MRFATYRHHVAGSGSRGDDPHADPTDLDPGGEDPTGLDPGGKDRSGLDPGGEDRVGVLGPDGQVHRIPDVSRLIDLLGGDDTSERLRAIGEAALADTEMAVDLDAVTLRAPVPAPPSIRDFLAFEEHRRTTNGGTVDPDWYELPVFYFSNPAAVYGPADGVPMAPGCRLWDYELEVAAVIGRAGADLAPDEADAHIAGYTILCDWSARDIQGREMRQQLGPAKGKDTATSMGPWLVTPDELSGHLEPGARSFDLTMSVSVNGRRYGGGRLSDIFWSFGEMIAYASRGTRVMPGDIIGSGTVGTGCILELVLSGRGDEHPWLVPGDVVELSVEGLGRLRHRVLPAATVVPLRPRAGEG